MKNSQKSILGMLAIALALTSCQKDDLVDMDLLSNKGDRLENMQPEYQNSLWTPDPQDSRIIAFELNQKVSIEKPDCFTSVSEEKTDQESRGSSNDCYGTYNLSSEDGRGWVDEIGSFTLIVDLDCDPVSQIVSGTVTLVFDVDNSRVVLGANGSMTKGNRPSSGSTLEVGLKSIRNSRSNGLNNFKGHLYIKDMDKIFNNRIGLKHTMVLITGSFGVEVRNSNNVKVKDPGNKDAEQVHNNKYN
jgi:hypothetical protein